MEARSGVPTWLLVLQFVVAVLIMAFLLAGPGGLEAVGTRIRPPRPSQHQPAQARAPERSAPRSVAPSVVHATVPVARPLSAPSPRRAPAVERTPRAQHTPARIPTPRLRAQRPTPAPAATVTTPPLTPQQYVARLMREGYHLYQAGWYGPAVARFKEAARASPGSASPHLWHGRAALRMGRTAEARAALERAIALAPSSEAAREARVLLERLSATE
jgi:TolA-binding protein